MFGIFIVIDSVKKIQLEPKQLGHNLENRIPVNQNSKSCDENNEEYPQNIFIEHLSKCFTVTSPLEIKEWEKCLYCNGFCEEAFHQNCVNLSDIAFRVTKK